MITANVIPTHRVAVWLVDEIRRALNFFGLQHHPEIEQVVYIAIIVLFALLLGWLVRKGVLYVARRLVRWHHTDWGADLLHMKVLSKCSHIIPPLVILALIPFAFDTSSRLLKVFETCDFIYFIITMTIAVCVVISFFWHRYDERENTRNLPLSGIRNLCIGLVWAISVIVIGSVLMGKSPVALLTGLGAFAAVLSFIFKDTILGFMAGIQLSQNDMLHIGDWIVVPSTIANGIVIDMSLTAVKVQNWDNTIVTLPPYTLISSSFQNWRGMSASGYRQICRSAIIDSDSVVTATPELIEQVSKLPGMEKFIEKVKKGGQFYDPGLATVNGTLETNLGLFRAYMCNYLLNHPLIGTDQQILVRVMEPNASGYPLQIWCFTTTKWTAYEAVQSEIFEHIAVSCQLFGLRLFNSPSGTDITSVQVLNTPVMVEKDVKEIASNPSIPPTKQS